MPGLWTGDASAVELEPPSLVEPRRPVPPSMPALLSPVEGEHRRGGRKPPVSSRETGHSAPFWPEDGPMFSEPV